MFIIALAISRLGKLVSELFAMIKTYGYYIIYIILILYV